MAYTLISSIGTGIYEPETGYKTTNYHFKNGDEYQTNLFLKAILQSNAYCPINEAFLIGTTTSAWDILAEDIDSSLWYEIRNTLEQQNAFSNELCKRLQEKLTEKYGITFHLKVHTNVVDDETIEDIFKIYAESIDEIVNNNDIVLDITHGFRSMPVFMYQSLLFRFSHLSERRIHIIYGEYIRDQDISYVRDLSKYWELSQITEAKNLFINNLDGTILAKKIRPFSEECAKCIMEISGIVACNYSLQIFEVLRQIKNTLNTRPLSSSPAWVDEIRTFLEEVYNRIAEKKDDKPMVLYLYAKFLAEKHLYTQAIIALQAAVELCITLILSTDESAIGDYDYFKSLKALPAYKEFYKQVSAATQRQIKKLEYVRNQIAHGGAKSKYRKGFPRVANIKNQFDAAEKAVAEFLQQLTKRTL